VSRSVVLALDQGTTSSRAIVFDRSGRQVAIAQREFPQGFPSPGHVTHDPEDIWSSQLATARDALATAGRGPADVAAIGVANQRETTIVWDRRTGQPVAPAIVWQSRITEPLCDRLRAAGLEPLVRERTGLPIDPYFSGPKVRHILDADPPLRSRAERGELAFGTVDTFLLWRLTGGRVHATDVSNASRTMLLDIRRGTWDEELCRIVGVPLAMLPEVRPTAAIVGETDAALFGAAIPIGSLVGDQQAATFGQACLSPGDAKVTYGTGAFLLLATGATPVPSVGGLLTTVLWRIGEDGPLTYALEGSVFVAGAAVGWLRDGLGLIASADEVERLARSVTDSDGVVFVPALVGLGAPHWDPDARGLIIGLTRGTTAAHLARAALEGIACSVRDVTDAMAKDLAAGASGTPGAPGALVPAMVDLRADGGMAASDLLLELQADLCEVPVERPVVTETTAWGAAALAGLAVGLWSSAGEIATMREVDRRFQPTWSAARRAAVVDRWRRAVERSRGWAAASPGAPVG
jgi:glycerol kinase